MKATSEPKHKNANIPHDDAYEGTLLDFAEQPAASMTRVKMWVKASPWQFYRERAGLTKKDIASDIGCLISNYTNVECGHFVHSHRMFRRFCVCLKLDYYRFAQYLRQWHESRPPYYMSDREESYTSWCAMSPLKARREDLGFTMPLLCKKVPGVSADRQKDIERGKAPYPPLSYFIKVSKLLGSPPTVIIDEHLEWLSQAPEGIYEDGVIL